MSIIYPCMYYQYPPINMIAPEPVNFVQSQPFPISYQQPPQQPKGTDAFRTSILMLVDALEHEPRQTYLISQLCSRFNFQRRRFYDVVNVFEAAGCCHKSSVDSFIWIGLKNVKLNIAKLGKEFGAFDPSKTLEDIFKSEESVTISKLTQNFLLIFVALNKNILDIKQISSFISRSNGRFKTTLCKLYQISHILEVVGIIDKTMTPGEVSLNRKFIPEKNATPKHNIDCPSLSIEYLLNKSEPLKDAFESRWEQFTGFQGSSPVQSQ